MFIEICHICSLRDKTALRTRVKDGCSHATFPLSDLARPWGVKGEIIASLFHLLCRRIIGHIHLCSHFLCYRVEDWNNPFYFLKQHFCSGRRIWTRSVQYSEGEVSLFSTHSLSMYEPAWVWTADMKRNGFYSLKTKTNSSECSQHAQQRLKWSHGVKLGVHSFPPTPGSPVYRGVSIFSLKRLIKWKGLEKPTSEWKKQCF